MTECGEIEITMDVVSTKKTNTIATKKPNVTSIALINYYSKKERNCYILHTVLLAIILLLIITIICHNYAKQKGIKWKIMNLKKFVLKIIRVIISMTS